MLQKHNANAYLWIGVILFIFIASGCRNEKKAIFIPDEINKKLVVSKDGNKIIFCSNRSEYYSPYLLERIKGDSFHLTCLNIHPQRDLFAESISYDGNMISLVSENLVTKSYDIFLYRLDSHAFSNLTSSDTVDDSYPEFSPANSLLAFISNFKLKVYDYITKSYTDINAVPDLALKNPTWSASGKTIYLEDYSSNIWKYDLRSNRFTMAWKCPAVSYVNNRLITPVKNNENEFYFISDHESDFNQIYKSDPDGKVHLAIHSDTDKFLIQRPVGISGLYYKTNEGGDFIVNDFSNGFARRVGSATGVYYDYYKDSGHSPIVVYASLSKPPSIFLDTDTGKQNLIGITSPDTMPTPLVLRNSSGMSNYLYLSENSGKEWVVWLHGGPYEQMSARYNIYLLGLLKSGRSVLVLNYPGSTGVGNTYELRGMSKKETLGRQLEVIRQDIAVIKNKYPTFETYCLVGVSHGSIPAHYYAKKYKNEVSKLIDFSGIAACKDIPTEMPVLYIYGQYDFALSIPGRINLIQADIKGNKAKQIVIDNEGHIINHKSSMEKVITGIEEFLN